MTNEYGCDNLNNYHFSMKRMNSVGLVQLAGKQEEKRFNRLNIIIVIKNVNRVRYLGPENQHWNSSHLQDLVSFSDQCYFQIRH